jgi:NTE family protein
MAGTISGSAKTMKSTFKRPRRDRPATRTMLNRIAPAWNFSDALSIRLQGTAVTVMKSSNAPTQPSSYEKKVALVLQGGGALGSYQAGVYEALAKTKYAPDWVAGISIGAINAAIIAGNAPADRVPRLRTFWESITAPSAHWVVPDWWPFDAWQRHASVLRTLSLGQPGFFRPRLPFEWNPLSPPLSYYDTTGLKATLLQLVDFDRINRDKDVRLSVGAVNVRTARFAYFDSAESAILPEHIMASAALPPGFPPVEIDGEYYWDGGLVSNTPLQHVLDYYPRRSRLTFQVDLFPGYGHLPRNLREVDERISDIRYASRTRLNTDAFEQRHAVRVAINELEKLLPESIKETVQAKRLHEFGCVTEMDVVQLIYRPMSPLGAGKDYEFGRSTMTRHWNQGKADATVTLAAAPWLDPSPPEVSVRIFDVVHDMLISRQRGHSPGEAETVTS